MGISKPKELGDYLEGGSLAPAKDPVETEVGFEVLLKHTAEVCECGQKPGVEEAW